MTDSQKISLGQGAFLVVALALVGCASQPSQSGLETSRPLVAPSTLGAERAVSQIVRGAAEKAGV